MERPSLHPGTSSLGTVDVKIWWTTLATAALIGGLVVVVTPGSPDPADDETMVMVGREHGDGALHFALDGRAVRGLYPGAVKQMRVAVVNPSRSRMSLQQLRGKVVASTRRGCPATAANLQIQGYSGKLPVTIAAYGRTTLAGTLPVTMPIGASARCAGARFTIALHGVGYRDGRR